MDGEDRMGKMGESMRHLWRPFADPRRIGETYRFVFHDSLTKVILSTVDNHRCMPNTI